jgi:triosephosphate isomerase
LKDAGLEWVVLGHSERRSLYGETIDIVGGKVKFALENHLKVIACVGEKLNEREENRTMEVVTSQLDAIKKNLKEEDWINVVVAYVNIKIIINNT